MKIKSRKLWVTVVGTIILVLLLLFQEGFKDAGVIKDTTSKLLILWIVYIGGNVLNKAVVLLTLFLQGRKKDE